MRHNKMKSFQLFVRNTSFSFKKKKNQDIYKNILSGSIRFSTKFSFFIQFVGFFLFLFCNLKTLTVGMK